MIRFAEPHAGCMVYLMLSIVINLFILILRISAHETQNNSTMQAVHQFDAATIVSVKALAEEDTSEMGKFDFTL